MLTIKRTYKNGLQMKVGEMHKELNKENGCGHIWVLLYILVVLAHFTC